MESLFIQLYDWVCAPGSHIRCILGHTRLTHGYLLKGEEPPSCLICQTKMTVKHILLDCAVFNVNRQGFYSEVCLTDLFKYVSPECILELLVNCIPCVIYFEIAVTIGFMALKSE